MQGMPGYGIVEQGLVIGTGDQLWVMLFIYYSWEWRGSIAGEEIATLLYV